MNGNNLQPNTNYNPSFTPHFAHNGQQAANAQARPVPPLLNASDLSSNPSARNLGNYRTNRPPEEEPDTFNLPEYQPIQPGEPYMEKLADEAMNSKKLNICLKNAQENEELEDFKDAEEAYEKALKYTDRAEDYKLYAACLSKLSATAKDEATVRVYTEKAAKAFYYLGGLYERNGASLEAHASYRASSELVTHEVPLQALVAVARKLGETGDIVDALVKLADFYTGKSKIDLAIERLEEAFGVQQSVELLEKLEGLYTQAGGEDRQAKLNKAGIQRFELQIRQDPKNIGVYRKYVWFLKDIGRRNEARAVKERMDGLLQSMQDGLLQNVQQNFQPLEQKLVKHKGKIVDLKQTIHSQAEVIHHLQAKLQSQAELIGKLEAKLETNASKSSKAIDGLEEKLVSLETEKFPEQMKKFGLNITDLTQKISAQAEVMGGLEAKLETNASKSSKAIDGLEEKLVSLETEKFPEQVTKLNSLNTQLGTFEEKVERLEKQFIHLDFSTWTNIQDSDFISLLIQNPYIKLLNLEGCSYLTDAVLAILPKYFENLKDLNLTRCKGVTEAGLDAIAENASKLKRLTLDHCPATTIKLLHKLNAKGIAFSIQGLSFKRNTLDLSARKADLTDAELLEALKANPEITELSLNGCQKITDAGLAPLKNFQWLTSLNLYDCRQLTDVGLQYLKGLFQLKSLDLTSCIQLTDEGLQHLAGLTQLTSLVLSSCSQLTGVGLQHLKGLFQLKSLVLTSCIQLTDEGWQHLAGLTQLKELNLTYCSQLTDVGLQHLKGLTQLTTLCLYYCRQLTDGGLWHLAGLTQLTTLYLSACSQLTDAGLQHLKGLFQLKSLNLTSCIQLTDAGLQHLKGLFQLTSLNLSYCKAITSNAKEQLKMQIPGLSIYG